MKQFQFKNNTYFRVGPGQTRGSIIYLCGATGEMLEVFEGVVTSTGPHYSWVAVSKNRDLNSVRVQRQAIQPNMGDLVLVWSLSFSGETVKAENLLVLGKTQATNSAPPKQPKPAFTPSLDWEKSPASVPPAPLGLSCRKPRNPSSFQAPRCVETWHSPRARKCASGEVPRTVA